jgi:hypothetical protein
MADHSRDPKRKCDSFVPHLVEVDLIKRWKGNGDTLKRRSDKLKDMVFADVSYPGSSTIHGLTLRSYH